MKEYLEKQPEGLSSLSPEELRTYKFLCTFDEREGKNLAKKFLCIRSVLNDESNIMRYAQAALVMRSILNSFLVKPGGEIQYLRDDDFEEFDQEFNRLYDALVEQVKDKKQQNDASGIIKQKYAYLKKDLMHGTLTKPQQMKLLLGDDLSRKALPQYIQELCDSFGRNWNEIGCIIHEKNIEKNFKEIYDIFLNFLRLITQRFFEITKEIDPYLDKDTYSKEDMDALKMLITRPECCEYFFKKYEKIHLFEWLRDQIKAFDSIPDEIISEDGSAYFIPWWQAQYLQKVSSQIPDKVLDVLRKLKSGNHWALSDCARCILNFPEKTLISRDGEIYSLLKCWRPTENHKILDFVIVDLIKKYFDLQQFTQAWCLLEILASPSEQLSKEEDSYFYKNLLQKQISIYSEEISETVLLSITKRLDGVIIRQLSDRERGDDFSKAWRPTIEDSGQNRDHGDIRDIYVTSLRDSLIKLMRKNSERATAFIDEFLTHNFSIFPRIAMYCLSAVNDKCWLRLALKIMLDDEFINNSCARDEFCLLLGAKFNFLNDDEQEQVFRRVVLSKIDKVLDEDQDIKLSRRRIAERLSVLSDYLDASKILRKHKDLFEEYAEEILIVDSKEPMVSHSFWRGPTSPIGKEELLKFTPQELILWMKENLRAPFGVCEHTPEGLARILEEVVEEKCVEYAKNLMLFSDEDLWPAYLCGVIRGLGRAISKGKTIPFDQFYEFIVAPLIFSEDKQSLGVHDKFDIGQYSWVRGAISGFIQAIVQNDDVSIDDVFFQKTLNALTLLLEDDDPSVESEQKYGPYNNNMDYLSFAINCNRGKALEGILCHLLRRYRQWKALNPHSPTDDFLKGIMVVYKDIIEKHLQSEKVPSVTAIYGRYLPYLIGLDPQWIEILIKKAFLFSQRDHFKEAQLEGFVKYSGRFDRKLYFLIKHYIKESIGVHCVLKEQEKGRASFGNQLVDCVAVANWLDLELISNKQGSVRYIFENCSDGYREHFIRCLGHYMGKNPVEKSSKKWGQLKKLWKERVSAGPSPELIGFISWLGVCPEQLGDLIDLIEPMVPYVGNHFHEREFLEYLESQIEGSVDGVLYLFKKLLKENKNSQFIMFSQENFKNILRKAQAFASDAKIKNQIVDIANYLGKKGHYDYDEFA